MDVITDDSFANPESMMISKEDLSVIKDRIGSMLSDLEMDALIKYTEGKSYQEISDELGRHVKSIDNALQRVKRKLQKYLESK